MGEIRIVVPGKTRGFPYLVCKKEVFLYELRAYLIYVKVGESSFLILYRKVTPGDRNFFRGQSSIALPASIISHLLAYHS